MKILSEESNLEGLRREGRVMDRVLFYLGLICLCSGILIISWAIASRIRPYQKPPTAFELNQKWDEITNQINGNVDSENIKHLKPDEEGKGRGNG